MVSDAYRLRPRKAWICRIAGAAFLFFAACAAGSIALSTVLPEVVGACGGDYCEVTSRPVDLLPTKDRAATTASPATRQAFEAYLERPLTRLGMAGVTFVGMAPFAILLLGVGLALRRLGGRGGDPVAGALPWLRRASIAAIVWALTASLHDSLLVMLLYPGTPAGPHWYITINVMEIGTALMLAIAAYAAVWALEAGLQAQRDMAEIV